MAVQRNMSTLLVLVVLIGLATEGQSRETSVECGDLSARSCAFAVDSHGARCVLETRASEDGGKHYQCQTSEFRSAITEEYIESESCVKACGVDRMTVGISTDEFFLPGFAESLCSRECQMKCSNIVDLFSSIVASAAKGASLGKFCNDFLASQGHRRQMRVNPFNAAQLASVNGISPSSFAEGPSSFAAGPSTSFDDGAEAPTGSFAEGPLGDSTTGAPAQFPFL